MRMYFRQRFCSLRSSVQMQPGLEFSFLVQWFASVQRTDGERPLKVTMPMGSSDDSYPYQLRKSVLASRDPNFAKSFRSYMPAKEVPATQNLLHAVVSVNSTSQVRRGWQDYYNIWCDVVSCYHHLALSSFPSCENRRGVIRFIWLGCIEGLQKR